MRQKGFATIFGLCLILVIALIVRSINDAEANHAREVVNFQTEQALQLAAESAIVEAADIVRHAEETGDTAKRLPYSIGIPSYDQKKISVSSKTFKRGEQEIKITVEVWGERGKIYVYPDGKTEIKAIRFATGFYPSYDGVYFMSRATIDGGFFGEKIYRRAFGHVRSVQREDGTWKDDTTIYFMELPTLNGNTVKKT